jgi:hypothetical protein
VTVVARMFCPVALGACVVVAAAWVQPGAAQSGSRQFGAAGFGVGESDPDLR